MGIDIEIRENNEILNNPARLIPFGFRYISMLFTYAELYQGQ